MEKADLLLCGAIDMHAHGYPQFTLNMPGRQNDLEWAYAARDARMAGFVIKSHLWPTATDAYLIRSLVPELVVFGSITLNYPVGGLSPFAVQTAAEEGAKIVFMPTWCSKNDVDKGAHYVDRMRPYVSSVDLYMQGRPGISVLDAEGALLPETLEVIALCKSYDLVLASGHISIEESLALCKEAVASGVKFVLTHPLNTPLIGASFEQMELIAEMGGYIENVFIGCMPMHSGMDPRRIADTIRHIGAKHCTMGTDAIEAWNPPPPEILRMYIATMLALGISEDDVYTMTHTNPAYLLGMDCGNVTADEADQKAAV